MKSKTFIFPFPCQYPIKIMCDAEKNILEYIFNILEKYIEEKQSIKFSTKFSRNNKYISLTAIFQAKSKNQINEIYNDLISHKKIHMVL